MIICDGEECWQSKPGQRAKPPDNRRLRFWLNDVKVLFTGMISAVTITAISLLTCILIPGVPKGNRPFG